ncbi:protein BTG3 isoform X2 [Engraulis encrasicolus]|uniref:protein BTG3 isoform X2 n=1 Tax=Engraulis encrasicolus TaxID=184585 RepID=UPI002FD01DD4
MKREVSAAVNFLKRIALERGRVDETKGDNFGEKLHKFLCEKYTDHWYPENPSKGQAFRCIRINATSPCDECVRRACEESEIQLSDLGLPREITLWVDPLEVCVRSGENCRFFTIASFSENEEVVEVEDKAVVKKKGNKKDVAGVSARSVDLLSLDTSDYHSASSSDCSSEASSEAEEEEEEEEKEKPAQGEKEQGMKKSNKKKKEKEMKAEAEKALATITMKPRPRGTRTKVPKSQIPPAGLQYFYHPAPAPVWQPAYKKKGPVFLTTVCGPPPPPMMGYYVLPQPPPQFIIPHATLQPWGSVKG